MDHHHPRPERARGVSLLSCDLSYVGWAGFIVARGWSRTRRDLRGAGNWSAHEGRDWSLRMCQLWVVRPHEPDQDTHRSIRAGTRREGWRGSPGQSRVQRQRLTLRAGLVALAVPNAFVSALATVCIRVVLQDLSGFGLHWVKPPGAFRSRPVSDIGGALLAIALLTSLAGLWLDRRLVQAALVTVLFEARRTSSTT
jgi:hypothetical protein